MKEENEKDKSREEAFFPHPSCVGRRCRALTSVCEVRKTEKLFLSLVGFITATPKRTTVASVGNPLIASSAHSDKELLSLCAKQKKHSANFVVKFIVNLEDLAKASSAKLREKENLINVNYPPALAPHPS